MDTPGAGTDRWGSNQQVCGDAPAKLNLALRIVGRRPDGFHLLEMYNVFVGFGDTVEVRLSPPGSARTVSTRVDRGAPVVLPQGFDAVETNLAGRAATELLERLGRPLGFAIEITKRVPLGAGLGGGSSDAAAVIKLILSLLQSPVPVDSGLLAALALELGADVPFFMGGRAAFACGIGEILEPIATGGVSDGTECLVIVPPIAVPTPRAYGLYRAAYPDPLAPPPRAPLSSVVAAGHRRAFVSNDLEGVVVAAYPDIGAILARVRAVPGCLAGMTGSGSALFAIPPEGATFAPGVSDHVRAAAGCAVIPTTIRTARP